MARPFLVLLFFLGFTSSAFSQSWDEMSSGEHSLREAGSEFVVEVPVQRIDGAKLLLFNERVAKQLGLEVPGDWAELEKMILEKFAYVVAKSRRDGDPSKKWFATYYQDGEGRKKGDARGDGRALWSGELKAKNGNRVVTIDVVLKGIGQTPLAWTNHADPGHKDGLQNIREAIHSFIMSEANAQNNLNTTVDLAVIELPILKKDKYSGKEEKTAITIRVGEQLRTAHFVYWYDKPEKMQKLSNYVIKRVLGLGENERVNAEHRRKYFDLLAENLADEAARYLDLFIVHGSPTAGNRTISGATIDLGTFKYLDAHHVGYKYLFDRYYLGGKNGQTHQLEKYLTATIGFFQKAGLRIDEKGNSDTKWAEFSQKEQDLFWKTFYNRAIDLWLTRIGLDSESRRNLSEKTKRDFYDLMTEIYKTQTDQFVQANDRRLKPAAFDPRLVMKSALKLAQITDIGKQRKFALSLLEGRYQWSDKKAKVKAKEKVVDRLIEVVQAIASEVPDFETRSADFLTKASEMNRQVRPSLGAEHFDEYELPLLQRIKENEGTAADWTAQALAASNALVDSGLSSKRPTNLGVPSRANIAPPAEKTQIKATYQESIPRCQEIFTNAL